jgi:dolichol kinase
MTAESLLPMLLVAGSYLAMFAIGELLRRKRGTAAGTTRRIDHVVAGCIALALPLLFDSAWPVIALAIPFVGFLLGTMLMGWLGSVHAISHRSAGAVLFPVAIAAIFTIAADSYVPYAIAVLALTLGDTAGGIAGARWGGHTYRAWGQAKTLEGSLAVGLATSLVTAAVLVAAGGPPLAAGLTGILTGLVVALVEGALPWGMDNIGIPIAALASLQAAGSFPTAGLLLLGATAVLALALAASRVTGRGRRRRLAASRTVAPNGP